MSHLQHDLEELRPSAVTKRFSWHGKGGMHWDELKGGFQKAMLFSVAPFMIIIHLGGNDLVTIKQGKMIKWIKRDLKYIASVFPQAILVWSDILPRQKWRGMINSPPNLKQINNKRKRINRAGRQAVNDIINGRSIVHEIDLVTPGLFKADGCHLTLVGNAIFLNTLEEAVSAFLSNPQLRVYNSG